MGALGNRYGLSHDALYRHRKAHLPPQVRARLIAGPALDGVDLERLHEQESQSILANLVAIRQRLFAQLDACEEHGDGGGVVRVVGALHRNIELTGELVGRLNLGTVVNQNILIQPMYLELRVELVRALQPFAEARQAVAQVLRALEGRSAEQVAADTRELAR